MSQTPEDKPVDSLVDVLVDVLVDSHQDSAHDDVDHFTCCDPAYYLATDRPVYSFCGHKLADGESIKLDLDGTEVCQLCLSRAVSLAPGELPCERLCPQLVFG